MLRQEIEALRRKLTPETYAENKAAWDALAAEIETEGRAAWYGAHEEATWQTQA